MPDDNLDKLWTKYKDSSIPKEFVSDLVMESYKHAFFAGANELLRTIFENDLSEQHIFSFLDSVHKELRAYNKSVEVLNYRITKHL